MNDEHEPRPSAQDDASPQRSRWAVSPGSVSDSFGSRRSGGGSTGEPGRRSAADIIAELQRKPFHEDQPTRVTQRRPLVPPDSSKSESASAPDGRPSSPAGRRARHDAGARTADERVAAERVADERVAAERADDERRRPPKPTGASRATMDDEAPKVVQRKRRAPLYDESARVEPDLGEPRDLTAASGSRSRGMVMAGFGGVILIIVGCLVGAIVDYAFSGRIGWVTAVTLSIAAAAAALFTRKRDLVSVLVAPPVVYACVAFLVLLLSSRPVRVTSVADLAIRGFPAMALATGLAALIAGVRWITSKPGDRG